MTTPTRMARERLAAHAPPMTPRRALTLGLAVWSALYVVSLIALMMAR